MSWTDLKRIKKILLGCDTHPHCSGWSLGVSESVFNHSKKGPLFVFGATPCLEEGRSAWLWLCQTCSPAELWSLTPRPLRGSRYGAWLCHNPPVESFFQSGQNLEIWIYCSTNLWVLTHHVVLPVDYKLYNVERWHPWRPCMGVYFQYWNSIFSSKWHI